MMDQIKTHGILMITAWMLCANIALFIARFYRHLPGGLRGNIKTWFIIHVSLMAINFILTAASFVLVFVHFKVWINVPEEFPHFRNAHPYIGTTVCACVVLNPLMALCRPRLTSPRRVHYNWVHWVTGRAGSILAVLNIFIGLHIHRLTGTPVWWLVLAMALLHYTMESIVDKTYLEYDKLPRPSELLNETAASSESELENYGRLHPGLKTSGFLYACLGGYVTSQLALWIAVIVMFP